jgi:hypothetical protein
MIMASTTKLKLKRLTPDTLVEFMQNNVKEPMSGPKIMALLRAHGYRHVSFHNVLCTARKNGEWRIVTIPNYGFMYTEDLDDAIYYNERRKSSLSTLRSYVRLMLATLNYNKVKRMIGCD